MQQNIVNYLNYMNHESLLYYYNGLDIEIPQYVSNILKARYNKVSRIKDHFLYIITRRKYVFFLTFTFNDDYINKCDRTKKDLIKHCLNDIDDSLYILNIDYGEKNEREHYHCILGTDFDFSNSIYFDLTYPCFSYCERISLKSNDVKKVSKYINKLSNHAAKSSTGYNRIYYNFKGYNKIKDRCYRNYVKLLDKELINNFYVGST